eukprot:TRINITY_DN1852_c0_g1_i13.p3 TRINITY_DN1852_c0_g1~~TRINITY_DN1852_c0_g1_i13.p3  ORF type:complete len:190 (+),score=3.98 TRINITY_DN1852_c0_g1_i13:732-1301(+)
MLQYVIMLFTLNNQELGAKKHVKSYLQKYQTTYMFRKAYKCSNNQSAATCVYCLHVYKRFLQVPKYNKSKNNSYLYLKQILKLKASLKCKLNGMAIKRRQCQNKKFCVGQQPLNSTSFTNVNNNSSKVKKQAYIDNMNNIQTTIIICKSNKLSLLEKEFNDYITVDPRQSQQYLGRRFFKPFGPINSIG